jgi:hypothetical protein
LKNTTEVKINCELPKGRVINLNIKRDHRAWKTAKKKIPTCDEKQSTNYKCLMNAKMYKHKKCRLTTVKMLKNKETGTPIR